MNNGCSFCDAIFRSGDWIDDTDEVPVWRCPECDSGWKPMADVDVRIPARERTTT